MQRKSNLPGLKNDKKQIQEQFCNLKLIFKLVNFPIKLLLCIKYCIRAKMKENLQEPEVRLECRNFIFYSFKVYFLHFPQWLCTTLVMEIKEKSVKLKNLFFYLYMHFSPCVVGYHPKHFELVQVPFYCSQHQFSR